MYYILEIQTNADETSGILTYSETDKNRALSKYHELLMYAAISNVYIHTVMIVTSEGRVVSVDSFKHTTKPQESTVLDKDEVN